MNRNVIKSGGTPAANSAPLADIATYENGKMQQVYPIMKWQLTDLFSLFDEVVFRVRRIQTPENVEITLMPFDDALKSFLLNDSSDDYYFVFNKTEYTSATLSTLHPLLKVILAKNGNSYYIYLNECQLVPKSGVGEDPVVNGIRIPNPPKVG
jgi:hypothetical protein